MNNKNKILEILQAPRFWVMVLGIVSVYLESKGLIGEAERNLIAGFAGLFVTVGTFDRTVDKIAESGTSITPKKKK